MAGVVEVAGAVETVVAVASAGVTAAARAAVGRAAGSRRMAVAVWVVVRGSCR